MTSSTSFWGIVICLCSFIIALSCVAYFGKTGAEWSRWIGLVSFALAFASVLVGFTGETANQIVRHVAHKNGRGPAFFRQYERPSLCRQIIIRFSVKGKAKPVRMIRLRSNVRSYNRASRPAFAGVSDSSKGDSGNSASGDPPEPPQNTTPRVLQPHSLRKSHFISLLSSATKRLDCWRLPSQKMRRCI